MDGLAVSLIAPNVSTPSCPYKEIEPTSTQEKLAQAIWVGEGSRSSLLSVHQKDTREDC